jgi:uncharacterized membrane protein YedE/YeeE
MTTGTIFLILLLGSFYTLIADTTLFIRFLIGLGFGFVLVRSSLGFAGSVNKLYRVKSANNATLLMYIFLLTSILTAFIIGGDESSYRLSIYPINLGLVVGGLMFGFGMAMSSCCATGSLTDLASGFSRALVTIVFFGLGVFLGFYTQGHSSFVTTSLVSSPMGEQFQGGVFLPDLFYFDGFNGYLGATALTAIFALVVIKLATYYEKKFNHSTDERTYEVKNISFFETVFVHTWKMWVSVIMLSSLFASLLWLSHKGWSASSALGIWFGKVLMLFGVEVQTLESFTGRGSELFVNSLFSHATSLQNMGIIFGSMLALIFAGVFTKKFITGLKITPKGVATFAFGGLMMGLGTRLSNGCNVGALFTPIAEFSLSGWIYLIFVVIGGFAGNSFVKRFISKSCSVI